MASLGDFTVTIDLPKGFHRLPEAVQLALVERMNWEITHRTIVSIESASLVGVLKSDSYRRLRLN